MSDDEYFDFFEGGFEHDVLTVTDIQRYIVDPVFLQQTGLTDHSAYDAYDMTVADGRCRVRVVLSSFLDHLVQKRKIRVGSRVKLTSVKVRFDETTVNGPGIAVVEDLTVVSQQDAAGVSDLNRLPWCREKDSSRTSCPLASRRGYYMDLWSNTDVTSTADDQAQLNVFGSLGDISSRDLYSMREIATRWQALKPSRPRLLLRVMRRSKLFHYARPSKTDRWPFQLQVVVGDETGCCMAVFWNVMALRYQNYVQEGSVILLRNFTVKPRFQIADHPVLQPPGLCWHDVDININAHNPQSDVTLIDESDVDVLDDVRLPSLTTDFVSRRELRYVPDGHVCDIAGVVTFVGAVQREKAKGKSGLNSGGFWVKRWLQLQDHSSDLPFVVQLYRGTQKEEFEEGLVTGAFVVCRNMRVVHGLDDVQSSRQPRHVHVTSTRDTQLYINEVDEEADYPFPDDPVLASARQFASSTDCSVARGGAVCQMMFSFPPQPASFEAFTTQHQHLELTPCSGWQAFIDSLTYREATQIALQARLRAVAFQHAHAHVRRSKRTQRPLSQEQVTSTSGETSDGSTVYLGYNPVADDSDFMRAYAANMEEGVEAEDSVFSLQWQGLNSDIVLNTVKACNLRSCPRNLSLNSLLSGVHDAKPGEETVDLPESIGRKVVESATSRFSAALTRYLVLLDVYCLDGERVMMGVNRAFPLHSPR